jgi:hypothetical protein
MEPFSPLKGGTFWTRLIRPEVVHLDRPLTTNLCRLQRALANLYSIGSQATLAKQYGIVPEIEAGAAGDRHSGHRAQYTNPFPGRTLSASTQLGEIMI